MTVAPSPALYFLGIGGNLLLILACLYFGPSLKGLCRLALWLNGLIVGIAVFFLIWVLDSMRTSSEAGLALGVALIMPAPFVAEFIALAAIYRWRMRQQSTS